MKIAIVGATGFVGRHLSSTLLFQGHTVKALARRPEKMGLSSDHLQLITCDLTKKETLQGHFKDVDVIYYLAHGLDQSGNFDEIEKLQVQNFTGELKPHHRVIYLSGLGEQNLSVHLSSRQAVGEILRSSKAKVVEFRASIVIGEGSSSFEMIRAIVERFPIILDAKFSHALCQPIALKNLLEYLVQASTLALETNRIVNIGGQDQVRYLDLLLTYAKLRKLARPVLKIEDFPKVLVNQIMKVFLPDYYDVGSKLLSSIEIETIVKDETAKDFSVQLIGVEEAMKEAMKSDPLFSTISVQEMWEYGKKEGLFDLYPPQSLQDEWLFFLPVKKNLLEKVISPKNAFKLMGVKHQLTLLHLELNEVPRGTEIKLIVLYQARGFIDANSFIFLKKLKSTFLDKYKSLSTFHKNQ